MRIYRTRHHKWQKQKIDGYHFQTVGLRGTKGKRNIWSYQGKKLKDAPKLCKIPRSECPDIRIRLPWQKWSKSMRGKFRRSYWNMEGRKFPIGNVSLFMLKRVFLIFVCGRHICVCGWHKIGWHKINWKITKSWSDVRHTSFSDPVSCPVLFCLSSFFLWLLCSLCQQSSVFSGLNLCVVSESWCVPLLFTSRSSCKRSSYHCGTWVTDSCRIVCVLCLMSTW